MKKETKASSFDFINLINNNSTKPLKVVIIGAGGKVSKEVIKNLYQNFLNIEELKLVLFVSDVKDSIQRMQGFIADIESSMFLARSVYDKKINIIITNNYNDIINSNLIIVLAGKWSSISEIEQYKKIDQSGRLVQSFVNHDMIADISKYILKLAPEALVAVVTNQSDMMASIARAVLGNKQQVIGIGGSLDSARFRKCLIESYVELSKERKKSSIKINSIEGHIVGYHDSSMIPLYSSIKINGNTLDSFIEDETLRMLVLEKAIDKTRSYGNLISKMQKDSRKQDTNTGSSILPGKAISQ